MRVPSLKTLRAAFPECAVELRRLLKANRATLEATEAGTARISECFNTPDTSDIRMCALNSAGKFYGVEYVKTAECEYADYLNTGDMYAPTIIRWRGNYRVQSIGDFIETQERNGIRFK